MIEAGPVGEDACIVCGAWPSEAREYLRWFISSLSGVEVEQVCDACLVAFWDNWAGRPDPDEPFLPLVTAPDRPRRR